MKIQVEIDTSQKDKILINAEIYCKNSVSMNLIGLDSLLNNVLGELNKKTKKIKSEKK